MLLDQKNFTKVLSCCVAMESLPQCVSILPSSRSTIPIKRASKLNKENRRWRNRIPLPEGLQRNEIYAHVEVVCSERKFDNSLLNLAENVRDVAQEILGRTYTSSQHSARFHLKVFVTTISDGGMLGTITASEKKFTWLGEAVVALAWRLYSKETKMYDGGMVTFKQQLGYDEFFHLIDNLGVTLVTEILAPECSYEIVSRVGVASTKCYEQSLS
jgi:hypothetical protein